MTDPASDRVQNGDVVRLKSGGPLMTVMLCADDLAYCVWFDSERSNTGMFRMSALEKVQSPPTD